MKLKRVVFNVFLITFYVLLTCSKLNGQNSDPLILTKESQHFNFFSTHDDLQVLDSLALTLENNYSRIASHLGIQFSKKINVKIYPNIQAFHAAINFPNAPDWVVGGTWNTDEIVMVSPLHPGSVHTYESLMQVVVHEFAHIAVYYARGNKGVTGLPRWLNEGYAQYEAGQVNERVRKNVELGVLKMTPPTWAQLDSVSDMEFGNRMVMGFL